ncbi:carbon-phosphorus lyase complex subunit PhnI [Candidatus Pelagisphaera phototrophica]|uniref:carbon-phosphorus lyase complex subunit PhnI n=1 Tax=Candidatus Pelagisphaera phototrophica TaxID=2684113 RepID=UPI001A0A1CCB|nr:carbon-phosphorus lyase complex subunit PhnI [Candidatus Pelagisphaera phototrophica]QXD31718.1 carbon-phosphorus lyase complex subunit PhnI [Candidatus Pelagisphaera phototrophica]
MGYVAIKGGEDAIENASRLVEYERVCSRTTPLEIEQIKTQLSALVDKIMGEGSLYAPEHAALALKQVQGCPLEGAFILRAYRATLNRVYYSDIIDTRAMRVSRRISSAFREAPGGQILGPTRDYTVRLLNTDLASESKEDFERFIDEVDGLDRTLLEDPQSFSKIMDILLEQGMLQGVDDDEDNRVVDVTREAVKFPAPRSAALQMLARAETGGLCALAYSSMRGFGSAHPTIGELRVGKAKIHVRDRRGRRRCIGSIKVTETEVISKLKKKGRDSVPYMTLGYGLCFGHNETKSICMGILDRTMRVNDEHPANSQEFVLYHTEGVESYGFTNHLKLPHYVTFQSGLDNLRKAMERKDDSRNGDKQKKTANTPMAEEDAMDPAQELL